MAVAGGAARPATARSGASEVRTRSPRRGAAEINLVGLTVDEALPRVDKLLDDAALARPQASCA